MLPALTRAAQQPGRSRRTGRWGCRGSGDPRTIACQPLLAPQFFPYGSGRPPRPPPAVGAGSGGSGAGSLAGTSCHLVAILGLALRGKRIFFFFFFSPNQPAAQQLLFWRRFARFVPQSHLRDLQGNRGAAAPNGEWASLSVACTGFGLALQSGKLLTCFLGVDFAGGEGWETLETSQVRPQPCWEKAGSLTGKTAALPRSSAAPGSSPLPCNDSGP